MTFPLRPKIFVAISIGVALTLSGCFSMPSIPSAVAQNQAQQQPAQQQSQPTQQSQQPSPNAAVAYQYQFNAFYGAMWNFGWFGYQDANYQPGQGTVWQITSSRSSGGPTTFERAFLKVNADTTQWWRLEVTGSDAKGQLVYEFLVGTDMKVQKVRYKDPGSGQIGEFVPDQSGQQGGPPQPTRQQLANSLVGTESVQVKAGTFTADHYSYVDPQGGYKGDSWISKTVPGYMVKFTGTNPNNNATYKGELVQIESGVTTVLGSY
jgi:hypothetical protein